MSNLSYYNNPSSEEDRSFGTLKYSVAIAEKHGLIVDTNDNVISDDQRIKIRSLQAIDLMKNISIKKGKVHKNELTKQKLQLYNKTSDLLGKSQIETNITKINRFNLHLQQLIDHKGQLIARLQQPFLHDYLAIHSDYHEYVCKLFPQLVHTLTTLNTQLDDIEWMFNLEFEEDIFENLLTDISTSLAGIQTNFQIILQMRQLIGNLCGNRP